jgi:hypothetical protein
VITFNAVTTRRDPHDPHDPHPAVTPGKSWHLHVSFDHIDESESIRKISKNIRKLADPRLGWQRPYATSRPVATQANIIKYISILRPARGENKLGDRETSPETSPETSWTTPCPQNLCPDSLRTAFGSAFPIFPRCNSAVLARPLAKLPVSEHLVPVVPGSQIFPGLPGSSLSDRTLSSRIQEKIRK